MKEPRAWKRDGQAGSDTLDRSSEGGSLVLFEIFLSDDLQQGEDEHTERA